MMKQKPELQIPPQKVLSSKKGKHGVLFQIKIAHYKPMWVPEMKLSKVALQSFVTGSPLPKKTYVVLERSYAKAPVKHNMKNINSFFNRKRGPPTNDESPTNEELEGESSTNKKSRSEDDGTTNKRKKKKKSLKPMLVEGRCAQSRVYIKKFNVILDLKNKSELVQVIREAKDELKPNKECAHLFQTEKFQQGIIIKHNKEHINCLSAAVTSGEIRCMVCEETFKASRSCRVINHCFYKTHVNNLKKKQDDRGKT